MILKALFFGATALALASPCLAQAQQPAAGEHASAAQSAKQAEDRATAMEGRIAAHKTALKLTPDQEKNWPAYEAALRNLAKLRAERRQEQKPTDPVALLRQRADDLSNASAALKHLADAEEVLFNSLDEAQKRQLSNYSGSSRDRGVKTRK